MTSLGGPPKQGTSLGGPPKQGTSLGGPPKQGTSLGGPPTSLGEPKPVPTTTETKTNAPTTNTLGTPSNTLGGPSNTLGGPKKGTALGGPPKPSEAPKPSDAPTDTNDTEDGADTDEKKKKKKKKPGKATASAPPAKDAPKKLSALAQKIKAEQAERERIAKEEAEALAREEAEEKRLEELRKQAELDKIKKKEVDKVAREIKEKERKERDAEAKRKEIMARFSGGGVQVGPKPGGKKSQPKKTSNKKAETKSEAPTDLPTEVAKPDDLPVSNNTPMFDNWEDALEDDDVKEEVQEVVAEAVVEVDEGPKEALRSPVCCVLGHVDTGKTKLLDKMRRTNVQDGEVGGITQQIGATYFPMATIKELTASLSSKYEDKLQYKVPGLLIIDTPGHEAFSNLRARGTSICDISILVVDIMHGLEQQTIESIKLLRMRNTPFVVALNKVDRLYEWQATPGLNFQDSLAKQQPHVVKQFNDLVNKVIVDFAVQELNASLYYKAKSLKDFTKNVSLVPTSAHTGEGIADLLMFLVQLTQKLMGNKLQATDNLQCTVLEVKKLEGLGTTIDVILASGSLREGDKILLCGLDGPIETSIKALLTPPPLRELRIKDKYQHHKEIFAAQGLKISANGLDSAIAGSQLFVVNNDADLESLREEVMAPLKSMKERVSKSKLGVYVQASTLGSLEALLDFLANVCKIPVTAFGIGPVHKKDVMIASTMVDKAPEYAVILAFDVKIADDARALATKLKVKVFEADIIYHLEDAFKAHLEKVADDEREKARKEAIFPCVLSIIPDKVFRQKDPIVLGVRVEDGVLKVNTPISADVGGKWLDVGTIVTIQSDMKDLAEAKEGAEVAIAINPFDNGQHYMFGRHFDEKSQLCSRVTRKSLDALKNFFSDDAKKHLKLLKRLKVAFNVGDI